jgi:Trk K+ transport system NAD-binding subunit
VVCSIREAEINRSLLYALRHFGYRGKVVVATQRDTDVKSLEAAGADLVLRPYEDAADQAVNLVGGRAVRTLPLGIPPETG